jgi:hypothetical protein
MKKQTPTPKKKYGPPWKIPTEPTEESYSTRRMLGLLGTKSGAVANYDLDKIKMKPKAPTSSKPAMEVKGKRPATTPKPGGVATTRRGNIKKK